MLHEPDMIARLRGGKSTSVEQAAAVAAEVLTCPDLFADLFSALSHATPVIRMRAAYAVSKVADKRPDLLLPYTSRFIERLADPSNSHLARACMLQTLHQLRLTPEDVSLLKDMLLDFMFSPSSIVKTISLHLLADFAEADARLRPEVVPLLWNALENGTPAMRARVRKLMKKYAIESF